MAAIDMYRCERGMRKRQHFSLCLNILLQKYVRNAEARLRKFLFITESLYEGQCLYLCSFLPPGTHCMNWIAGSVEPRAVRPHFVASLQ